MPADEIYDITFNNVQFTNLSSGDLAYLNGTIEVDYTNPSMTGTLTATVSTPVSSQSYVFSSFSSDVHSVATTASSTSYSTGVPTGALSFSYNGVSPTFLYSGSVTTYSPVNETFGSPSGSLTSTPVCFASGTLIRTPHGDVRVESLSAGDMVLTASGERRPIKWMGHRRFRRDFAGRKHEVVRIAAHAFGPDRPSQDLVVSPGHAICLDLIGEVLIPAMHLVNGATVTREWRDVVTLWHVELDSHDVLVANDLPAESYLAMGNRGFFEEAGATFDSFDEGKDTTHADFCRPVIAKGPGLAFVRERLTERARSFGWTPSHDDDLRLVVDGEIRRPAGANTAETFVFPAEALDIRLVSNTHVPKDFGVQDGRTLGVHLLGLVFSAGGETREIAVDDPRLRDGVHAVEPSGLRWTTGELVLDPELWKGLSGDVSLRLTRRRGGPRKWMAPAAEPAPAARPRLYAVG